MTQKEPAPRQKTSMRNDAHSKETYVKAKAGLAALFSSSGSRRNRSAAEATLFALPSHRGSGARLHGRRSLLALTATLAALLLTAPPALAIETHVFSTSFGSPGSAAGQLELSSPTYWGGINLATDGSGIALNNETHDVYVADTGNLRVDEFDPSKPPAERFIRAFGLNVGGAGVDVCATGCHPGTSASTPGAFQSPTYVAVDNSPGGEGDVYVADIGDGIVSKFSAEGELLTGWGVGGQLTGAHPAVAGIAVDPSGNLWVLSKEAVFNFNGFMSKYAPGGAFTTEWSVEASASGIATDSVGNLYVTQSGSNAVHQLTPTGTDLGVVGHTTGGGQSSGLGLAVDSASGDVYIDEEGSPNQRQPASVDHFPASCAPAGNCSPADSFGAGNLSTAAGLAVDPTDHTVYAADPRADKILAYIGPFTIPNVSTEAATEVSTTSATFNGTVDPESVALKAGATEGCFFEYGETTEYGQIAPCEAPDAEEIGSANANVAVHAKIALQPDTPYHYRLFAANVHGAIGGSDRTIPLPVVEADTVHEINGEGKITVFGVIEPNGSDSTYQFEFVTEKQFEESGWAEAATPDPNTPTGTGGNVSTAAPSLQPETGYRFRLSVEAASTPGEFVYSPVKTIPKPHALEPQPENCPNEPNRYGASARLPDCRAYEQITPSEKEGSQDVFAYGGAADTSTSLSTDGEHFLIGNTLAKYGKNVSGASAGNYEFNRTPTGWETVGVSSQPETLNWDNSLDTFFNEGFSQLLIERQYVLSANVASPTIKFALGPPGGPYKVVAEEPVKPDPCCGGAGEVFHEGGWIAQSRDGSVAVLETTDRELIPGHPSPTTGPKYNNTDIYAYYNGGLHQVNVETDGEPIGTEGTCAASVVQGREAGERGGDRNSGTGPPEEGGINSVSADGSRIFFYSSPGECARGPERTSTMLVGSKVNLYMRLTGTEETYDIGPYTFEGANPAGTRLLLGKPVHGSSAAEYFTYDTDTHLAKHAFTIPQGPIGAVGIYHAMSENGNDLFFSSSYALNREGGEGERMYSYNIDTETLTLVLPNINKSEGETWEAPYATTANGGVLTLTEHIPGLAGEAGQAVMYMAAEQVRQCIACSSPFDPHPKQGSTYIAQGGPELSHVAPLVTPASDNGDYVFFDTPNALLPNDIDGEIEPTSGDGPYSPSSDVYEWRRHGIDGCTLRQGCLALISSGIDGEKNLLLGTDPSGRDVFFATHSALVASDKDTQGDAYDARIGGGFPPPPPLPVQCEGDACHNPPNPPNDPTPGSSTYEGPGNEHQVVSKETKPKKHHKAKHKSHKRSHKRAGHNGGGAK